MTLKLPTSATDAFYYAYYKARDIDRGWEFTDAFFKALGLSATLVAEAARQALISMKIEKETS